MAAKEELKQRAHVCGICNITCSSALQLYEHVRGQKHRASANRAAPDSLLQLRRLQYYIDTYMKPEPLVGLEYVEELQVQGEYRYRCALCCFQGGQVLLFLHIMGPEHIMMYADKHHPRLVQHRARYKQRAEHQKAMQLVAAQICQLYGKKTITEIQVDDAKPTPEKLAKYSSDPQAAPAERNPVNGDERPAGFKANADFLDYLQKFQIRSDEDARIIRLITQNCTQALLRYQQEQQKELRGEAPAPANRTDKGFSVGNSGKVVPGSAAQTDPTQLFFNSIKNMEEAEVTDILQKIAATNPAFMGINVPNVIKYLRATGRLKTS